MIDLPKGWGSCLLDEINDPERPICYGILMPGPDLPDGIPYVKVRNIRADKVLVDEVHRTSVEIESKFARSRLRTGDVLVSIRGTYGRTASVPSELDGGNITQDTARVAPVGAKAAYVRLFMQSPAAQNYFKAVARGVAVKGVNIGDLRKLPVPVAPAAEQDRIVLAIEEAFSKLDAGEAGLRVARELLRHTRDAILSAAATGRLVPQDPGDTPPAKLLADLGVEQLDLSGPPEVPEGWAQVRIADIAKVGSGTTPKRGRSDYWTAGQIPWVTSGAVNAGVVREATEFVTETALRETSLRLWPAGTLLVAMYGEGKTRGRCAELAIEATCNQACAAIALRDGLQLYRRTLRLHFDANYSANRGLAAGGVQPNLSGALIKDMIVALPPAEEASRIVTEVERQMSFLDACERSVDAGLEVSVALRRSMLKAAFEGRLVPQDPSDEPASVPLERIRAKRAATPKPTKRRARATA